MTPVAKTPLRTDDELSTVLTRRLSMLEQKGKHWKPAVARFCFRIDLIDFFVDFVDFFSDWS